MGTHLYMLYRFVRPQKGFFFTRFGHKQRTDFAFLSEIPFGFYTLVLNSQRFLKEATQILRVLGSWPNTPALFSGSTPGIPHREIVIFTRSDWLTRREGV